MIGRRATVGLALICGFLFCALAAQSASATLAKNTTAFTCVKGAAAKDFSDPHCDTKVSPGTGEYGHESIKLGDTTKVVFTNAGTSSATKESTPAIFKAEPFKVKTEITCKTVKGEGTVTNEEPEAKVHRGSGSGTTEGTGCTVQKPLKCSVKEPIAVGAEAVPLEELGAEKNEMGGELKPVGGGKTFTTITFEGAECALKGKPFNVEGTAIGTAGTATQTEKQSGATVVFTNAMTKETLIVGAKPAEMSLVATVRRAPEQNPIAGTTIT